MKPNNKPPRFKQVGFSLIEILVGLAIGLLVTLVIMQVFSVFEGQKRTTTGVADAQTNGSIALFSIDRDLQMAGFGLIALGVPNVADSTLECATLNPIDAANTGYAAASGIAAIAPVIVTDGGSAGPGTNNSDIITIHYGATNMGGIPSQIKAVGASLTIDSDLGCLANDVALISNGNSCALASVAGVVASTSLVPATITLSDTIPPQALSGSVFGNLTCLGTWNEITYRVNNGNLERNGTPVITGIVNIQAQYGIADPANLGGANANKVVQWVNATSPWNAPTVSSPPSGTDRNLIKAIRIAIVARNGQLEKENVTNTCSSITSNAPNGLCAWSATSLLPQTASPAPWIYLSNDADGTSWQRYRYRVFETVIPLRNLIWAKSTL
jgi:type IV pilus assembly protein PilW